jgi:predicted amidohydrolase
LAVLPEYHLTNWIPTDPKFPELCGQWQSYLDKYKELARNLNICIVPGTIVELHKEAKTESEKLLNAAYFIGNNGEILGRYEKKNLWVGSFFSFFQKFSRICSCVVASRKRASNSKST